MVYVFFFHDERWAEPQDIARACRADQDPPIHARPDDRCYVARQLHREEQTLAPYIDYLLGIVSLELAELLEKIAAHPVTVVQDKPILENRLEGCYGRGT